MSRLALGLHRLRRSPWEVVWSALRSGALHAARRGHGAPPLPLPLPPRHAPHRRFGVSGGYCGGQVLEEVHRGGGVGAAVRAVQHPLLVGRLCIRHPERFPTAAGAGASWR